MLQLIETFTSLRPPSPHDIEIIALSRVTAALEDAAGATGESTAVTSAAVASKAELHKAVTGNTRLWIAFRLELLDEANRLPESLKANLDRVARVAIRHGSRVTAGSATPQLLIDINRAVIAGLDSSRRRARRHGEAQ